MLTVKSDDVVGRVKAYEKIVKGENIPEPGVPESFKVLLKELQAIGLDVQILNEDGEEVVIKELDDDDETEPEQTDELRRVMEGENGPETPAAPAEDAPAEGEEGEEQEPVANGGEDDIMSAMSLDAVAEAEQADDDEQTARDEHRAQSGLPRKAHALDDREREIGIQAHPRCKCYWIIRNQPHHQTADCGSQTGRNKHGTMIHTRFRQDKRVYNNDVTHGQKCGYTC